MKVSELMTLIDKQIPFNKAESWDNVGLLIGDEAAEVRGILTALDCTFEVVQEAADKECNTIICHHPLIFSGVKSIHEHGYGRVIRELIRSNIQLIALHTNLDAHPEGVSYMIGQKLQLEQMEILLPERRERCKLQIFVPEEAVSALKEALSSAGAGRIGDYSDCFFELKGKGQFKPNEHADPYEGTSGKLSVVDEVKLECVFEPKLRRQIEEAVQTAHPYEEPAYDIYSFEVDDQFGTGIKGQMKEEITLAELARQVKDKLQLDVVKVIGDIQQSIRTVGIIGGAGIDYVDEVAGQVDVFLTGDIKYHEAHDLLMTGLAAVDISHYAEYVMKSGLQQLLSHFIDDIDIYSSAVDTNPFQTV